MTQDQTIKRALKILDARMRSAPVLSSPEAVRDYLRLLLHDRGHEVFVCVFLDLCAVLSYVQHPHRSH